jgi:hypothetical protein
MTEFNVLTMNAKAYPGTALVCKRGARPSAGNPVDHHPIHLHGYHFKVVATAASSNTARCPRRRCWSRPDRRDVEFVADAPGDWPLHCHMTHHVMNQMGHNVPNMVGATAGKVDQRVSALVPGYMTMGRTGMGEMAEMSMPVPKNSIPMMGSKGPHDVITMGGMFTILKVREGLTSYADPGWYEAPEGTRARAATAEELARDGIVSS